MLTSIIASTGLSHVVVGSPTWNAPTTLAAGARPRAWPAEDWRVAFLFDPDGNVIELVQQPPGAASMAAFAGELRRRRDTP